MEVVPELKKLPIRICERTKNTFYIYKDKKRFWNGEKLLCEHYKEKTICSCCKLLCEHGKDKYRCRDCGKGYCTHGKPKVYCRDCHGTQYCGHNKLKRRCNQCNGSQLCIFCKQIIVCAKRYVSKTNDYVKACADCFYYNYPDEEKIPSRYKRKQHYIHEKLSEKYGKFFFEYDHTIDCGCSKRIPDWFRDCFNYVINIECDENQHNDRDTTCENKRLMELSKDIGHRPFICIRFNPDKYIENGELHKGCFTFDNKNNIIVDEVEFTRRWVILNKKIDYYLQNGTERTIHVEKLFFNN